tara:strand:+ start:1016 stop:1240 length:225 start_codon:yes stop_codon:yes gene_type:complete
LTEIKPDKIPYDPWFDYDIPQAQYGSLQCWIANESTAKWSTEVDITLHSKMYELATLTGLLIGASEQVIDNEDK